MISILVGGILLIYFFYDPTEVDIFPKCPMHSTTGIYCPGCGSQRALHSLLHLDFKSVVTYNFLFIPALGLFIYNLGIKGYNRFYNKSIPNIIYSSKFTKIVLLIIISFWVLRNIPVYPFNILAP
ncbi:DUF2752 domain-containing protein [Aureisphaera sp.]